MTTILKKTPWREFGIEPAMTLVHGENPRDAARRDKATLQDQFNLSLREGRIPTPGPGQSYRLGQKALELVGD